MCSSSAPFWLQLLGWKIDVAILLQATILKLLLDSTAKLDAVFWKKQSKLILDDATTVL